MNTQISQDAHPKNRFLAFISGFLSLKDEKYISVSEFGFRLSIIVILTLGLSALWNLFIGEVFRGNFSGLISIKGYTKSVALFSDMVIGYIFFILFYKRCSDAGFQTRIIEYIIIALGVFLVIDTIKGFSWYTFSKFTSIILFCKILLTIGVTIMVVTPSKPGISDHQSDSKLIKGIKLLVYILAIVIVIALGSGIYILMHFGIGSFFHGSFSLEMLRIILQLIAFFIIIVFSTYDTFKRKNSEVSHLKEPTSKYVEIDSEIKQAIDTIDVRHIKHIAFREGTTGRSYNILLDSIKRIAVIILNKTGKNTFSPHELSPEKELIFRYFHSSLPPQHAKFLEQALDGWFENGGSLEIVLK